MGGLEWLEWDSLLLLAEGRDQHPDDHENDHEKIEETYLDKVKRTVRTQDRWETVLVTPHLVTPVNISTIRSFKVRKTLGRNKNTNKVIKELRDR